MAVVLDWILQPHRQPISFRRLGIAVLFPLAYLAYALVRGAATGWYAYPFLNPADGGYGAVALTCVIVAAAFLAAGAVLLYAGNRLRPPAGASTG